MIKSSLAQVSSGLCLTLVVLSGCSQVLSSAGLTPESGPEPTSNATAVGFNTFGPAQPNSGLNSNGNVISGGSTGVFGTTDAVTVDASGPFPNDTISVDTSLSDFSAADQQLLEGTGLDLSNEATLASAITFTDDQGTPAFFDADIGTTVYFDTNSSELNEEAREILRKQAAWLTVNPNVNATIEGHADERGTREYNIALGESRASAVRGYFTALGIAGERIRKLSYGKERPEVLGSDETAWSRNRRSITVLEPQAFTNSDFSENSTFVAPVTRESSIDELLNDPILNDLPSGDPLLNDPLLNDPLLNDPLLDDPLLNNNT